MESSVTTRAAPRQLRPLPNFIFMSRWLQVPLYLGLILAQCVYVYHFWVELLHLVQAAMGSGTALSALISGIGWVSELIEIAGGEDILPKLRLQQAARDRIVSPKAVRDAAPDIILASWCGKKVVPDKIRKRPGWSATAPVTSGRSPISH